MRGKILYLAIFAAGLGLGAFLEYKLPPAFRTSTDQKWHATFSEDMNHERIMEYQAALTNDGIAMEPDKSSKQLEGQLKIEELLIKTREAKYAKITPFNATLGAIFIGVLGLITGWLGARRRGKYTAVGTSQA